MTHEDLRKRAVDWLTRQRRCGVVLSEMSTFYTSEIPDAIGWKGSYSILVEVKVSRSDFFAQRRKSHYGMGQRRYFLTPSQLIMPDDLPDADPEATADLDYGLLWASENQIRVIKESKPRAEFDHVSEMAMLVSALRRVRTREFLTIVQPQPGEEDVVGHPV